MITINLAKTRKGDFEVHIDGCKDLTRGSKYVRVHPEEEGSNVFTGETLVDAIIALDTDAAAWFGEEPYTQSSRDNGCWSSTNGFDRAPCFSTALKSAGVAFDADGRPFDVMAVAEAVVAEGRVCHRGGCPELIVAKSANLCPAHQSEWRAARKGK